VFSFESSSFFLFPPYFLNDPLTIQQFIVEFACVWVFSGCFYSFIPLWYDRLQKAISVFSYLLKLALFWRTFYGLLRRMCFLQLLGGIFYRCLLNLFDLECLFNFEVSLLILVWMTFLWEWGIEVISYCCVVLFVILCPVCF
jgi:hypothetical protein